MEKTKKKKRPKHRPSVEETRTAASISSARNAEFPQTLMDENINLDCVEEVVMNIDDVICISPDTADPTNSVCGKNTDISLQHVGVIPEINGNVCDIQETALTEVISTLPTAPNLGELEESVVPSQIVQEDNPKSSLTRPYTFIKFKQGYMPLSETSLVRLYNDKLKLSEDLSHPFSEKLASDNKHRFYINLKKFLNVHRSMLANVNLLETKKSQLSIQIEKVWDTEKKTIVETGECQDGNPVFSELSYSIHHFNQASFEVFNQLLSDLKDHCHQEIISTSHTAELLKQNISCYIEMLCNNCLKDVAVDSAVQLLTDSEQAVNKGYVLEIRTCIGVLFKFQQQRTLSYESYSNLLKLWLTKLVQTLLKVATKQDHMYILYHVLRIHKRIPDWMKQFIQIPLPDLKSLVSPFDSPHLAHFINVLSVLMHPVQNQPCSNEGELDIAYGSDDQDASWVLVDSEGEDECGNADQISVSDIIDLFNQLPMEQMYASILKIDKVDNRYVLNLTNYDDRYLMELFAFCTVLVKKYKVGLLTYGNLHQQQFAKRMGQFIKHTVQYVTDVYEHYLEVKVKCNNSSHWPLQCEYDVFVLRSVNAIYSSQNMGMWQFLATMPYHKISSSTLWQIYGLLHKDYNESLDVDLPSNLYEWELFVKQSPIFTHFENRLCVLRESESIYLLTAFSFMALPSREIDTSLRDFIRTVALNLFQIGFMCESTQDKFNKHIRTLLSSITAQYPYLISSILKQMPHYNFMDTESSCLDLFRDLPLASWVPNNEDLKIIQRWLLDRPLFSTEFSLARLILANLNYNANESANAATDLFLSHNVHCNVGILVVEAALRSVPEQPSSASSSTAALCDMVLKYVSPASGLEIIMKWAWRVLSQLRIHSIDRGGTVPCDTIAAPEVFLQSVPDLYGHEDLQVIASAVLRSQPISCYLAVMMSTLGHNVPLICNKGFPLVDLLVRNQCYREALKCVYLLVPMFLECRESLIQCDIFHTVIISIIGADKSVLKLGKPFSASPDFPGFHLRQLGSLITVHLIEAENKRYGPNALLSMICLWLQCLAKIPDWVNDPLTLYLMDIILREAFRTKETYDAARSVLGELYMMKMPGQTNPPSSINPSVSRPEFSTVEMFLQFRTKREFPQIQSLMSKVSLPNTPWFALFVLTMERDWQKTTGTWQAMQLEVFEQTGRTNIDAALKKALKVSDVPISMPPGNLAIYRLANQAVDTPIDHPILPYLWQMFFTLYLARVPADPSGSKGGIGHKLFEGIVGQNLVKQIKKQLLDTAAHYTSVESQLKDETRDDPVLLRENQGEIFRLSLCSKLFKTFHLWLEDQRLMDNNVLLPNLEPMYDIPKLKAIFEGDETIWGEYLSQQEHVTIHMKHWTDWQKLNYRYQEPSKSYASSEKRFIPPMEKTWKRLLSYETPVKFERAVSDPQPTPLKIPAEVMIYKENLLIFINEQLDVLSNIGQLYMETLAEHTALDCAVLEFLPSLYRTTEVEKILTAECHSSPPHRGSEYHARQSTCAGPAEIRVVVTESQLNQSVSESIVENRIEWVDVIRRVLRPPRYETCSTIATLDLLVVNLIKEYEEACKSTNQQKKIVLKELAVSCFFHLIENCTESIVFFPPSEAMMHTWLMSLAEPFIMNGTYVERLLLVLLEKPRLVPILSRYLVPGEARPSTFLKLYELVTIKAYEAEPNEMMYADLLSKFSVEEWLKSHHTNFSIRSTLIEEVLLAIEAAGLQPDPRNEKVHKIIREDFVALLRYDFPGHFGRILSLLLRGSAAQHVAIEVWYDFINALFGEKRVSPGDDMSKLKEEIRLFATEQKALTYNELQQTIELLGRYFLAERNMYALYGLYPKYRTYVEPIMVFQGMIHHSYIVATLSQDQGALSSLVCEKVWPALDEIYSPWIAPLQTNQMTEPPAPWIDLLADDRSILLPWIPPDLLHANKAVIMFIESARFILDTVSGEILSHLWQYYVAKFVHKAITDNVLSIIQSHMELLPWQQFKPRLADMDVMYKVIMQPVPAEVYAFLGTIFVKVAWVPWLINMMYMYKENYDVQSRLHVYMLHLHVKLSKDNDVRKWSKVNEMLISAKKFDWHLVDASAYSQVVDWWVFKYDPKVAAGLGEPYVNPIDICVMNLLEAAAGFSTEVQHLHSTTKQKRVFFIRGRIKMIMKCSNERSFVEKNVNDMSVTIVALLTLVENIIQRTVLEENRLEECSLLIKELVILFNLSENNELRKVALKVCSSWLAKENSMSIVVQGFLRILGTDITNSSTMGHLLEICLTSYFKRTVMQVTSPSWTTAAQLMSTPIVPNIEETLLAGGYILTLHAILYQQISCTKSMREELTLLCNLTDWICQLKAATIEESKLPLTWGAALLLIERQCQYCESAASVTRSIKRLISHFAELGEEKGQLWTFLGNFGLRKQLNLSAKGRFLCRAMAVFLLAQLPDSQGEEVTIRVGENAPGALTSSSVSREELVAKPNEDALKGLRDLEANASSKLYGELKDTVDLAVKFIKDPAQSILTARQVLGALTAELYTEQYLYILTL